MGSVSHDIGVHAADPLDINIDLKTGDAASWVDIRVGGHRFAWFGDDTARRQFLHALAFAAAQAAERLRPPGLGPYEYSEMAGVQPADREPICWGEQ